MSQLETRRQWSAWYGREPDATTDFGGTSGAFRSQAWASPASPPLATSASLCPLRIVTEAFIVAPTSSRFGITIVGPLASPGRLQGYHLFAITSKAAGIAMAGGAEYVPVLPPTR